ncbi:RNA polymerase sigma factor [Alicyclobacillus sp. SO9]|nr:RNA polymerase sigma factor [Alicyclobacillus sp. SO9]
MVYRVCLKITGNRDAAQDLAQDVFLKAYDGLPAFRQDASFSTWLYQITVRTCLDWKRGSARYQQRLNAVAVQSRQEVPVDTPEQTVVKKERSAELMSLMESLREPYRTVTKMFYLHKFSCQEIAQRRGVSVKTVESQLYRSRRILREKGDALR